MNGERDGTSLPPDQVDEVLSPAPFDPDAAARELVDAAGADRDPWGTLVAYARAHGLSEDETQQVRVAFVRAFVERAVTVPPRRGTSRHYRRRDRGPV